MSANPYVASVQKLLPIAALLLACGIAHAANPPRVMFVSGKEAKPVLVDLSGKEIPAKKGQVVPPGFSVKVPEGATVQIMTEEKAIVAIRQGSLLKLETLGDGDQPHKFKLDVGGLRVANSEKKPHKFEVDTPNAKIRFDKGDHEAYYFKTGNKVIGDRWGTFGRSFKDESVLSTNDGDTKIDRSVVAYVPGFAGGKTEILDRVKVDMAFTDVAAVRSGGGTLGEAVEGLNANQRLLSEGVKSAAADDSKSTLKPPVGKSDLLVLPELGSKTGKDLLTLSDTKPVLPTITKFKDPAQDIMQQPKFRQEINVSVVENTDGTKTAFGRNTSKADALLTQNGQKIDLNKDLSTEIRDKGVICDARCQKAALNPRLLAPLK